MCSKACLFYSRGTQAVLSSLHVVGLGTTCSSRSHSRAFSCPLSLRPLILPVILPTCAINNPSQLCVRDSSSPRYRLAKPRPAHRQVSLQEMHDSPAPSFEQKIRLAVGQPLDARLVGGSSGRYGPQQGQARTATPGSLKHACSLQVLKRRVHAGWGGVTGARRLRHMADGDKSNICSAVWWAFFGSFACITLCDFLRWTTRLH
jgi:hypothetical protein